MAFNPDLYETHYGFDTLDLAHNLFPELLYDEEAFPSETMRWIRHRLATRLPAQYVRQRALYDLYQRDRRRRELAEWREEETTPGVVPVVPVVPVAPAPAPATATAATAAPRTTATTASASTIGAHTSTISVLQAMPLAPPVQSVQSLRMPVQRTSRLFGTPLHSYYPENIIDDPREVNHFLNALFPPQTANPLINVLLNNMWADVEVTATNEQIDAGSTLRPASEVRAEEVCSICQEHEMAEGTDTQWRALHCSHSFHRVCVDRWFETHVACPVCRADVRDPPQ